MGLEQRSTLEKAMRMPKYKRLKSLASPELQLQCNNLAGRAKKPEGRADSISDITDESSLLQWTIEDSILARCKKIPPWSSFSGMSRVESISNSSLPPPLGSGHMQHARAQQYNRELAPLQ